MQQAFLQCSRPVLNAAGFISSMQQACFKCSRPFLNAEALFWTRGISGISLQKISYACGKNPFVCKENPSKIRKNPFVLKKSRTLFRRSEMPLGFEYSSCFWDVAQAWYALNAAVALMGFRATVANSILYSGTHVSMGYLIRLHSFFS